PITDFRASSVGILNDLLSRYGEQFAQGIFISRGHSLVARLIAIVYALAHRRDSDVRAIRGVEGMFHGHQDPDGHLAGGINPVLALKAYDLRRTEYAILG